MRRISVCAVLFLSSALAFGRQQPPYPGQTPFFFATPPAMYPGDASQQQEQSQSELREALRACAALLVAATSVWCPEDPSQQQAKQQPQPPQPPASLQNKSEVNSQIQSNLQGDLKSDPGLSGTDVETTVDDVNITLTGTVQSQAQLDRVMALTSPYAHYRNVMNKVTVK